MKTLLRFAALIGSLFSLVVLTQCKNDRPIDANAKPTVLITSAKQLAADTSFIAAVKMNRRVTQLLFNHLRSLGSDGVRQKQSAKIIQLLKKSATINCVQELSEQFGFANKSDFSNSIYFLFMKKVELNSRYHNFSTLDKSIYSKSYNQVVAELPDSPAAPSIGVVCVECHFNNCNECCDDCVATPEPGDGGGGDDGANCKNACQSARLSARNLAELECLGELGLACSQTFASVQEYLINKGQCEVAPLGGICAFLTCGTLAYARYVNNISLAESNYTACLYGCK